MPPYPNPDFSCSVLNFLFFFNALLKAGKLKLRAIGNTPRKYVFYSPQIFFCPACFSVSTIRKCHLKYLGREREKGEGKRGLKSGEYTRGAPSHLSVSCLVPPPSVLELQMPYPREGPHSFLHSFTHSDSFIPF